MLESSRQEVKPGKRLNDQIMLAKLTGELRPMQASAAHLIRPLTRADFFQMLLDLNMLAGPSPSKRDNEDAQAFLSILFSQTNPACQPENDVPADVSEI